MLNYFFQRFIILMLVGLLTGSVPASTPQIKTFGTQADFAAGKPKGVSINSLGEVVLAPEVNAILEGNALPFLWAGASDSRGNLYVAGGNAGEVFRIDTSGDSTLVFKSPEVQVYALAVDSDDHVYVGTSPNGKVYRLPGGRRVVRPQVAEFFDPGTLYIWALTFDRQGRLYVATGDEGNLFRVSRDGKGELFYHAEDVHVRSLAWDLEGRLLAGTADKGYILRLAEDGEAFVIYDAPLEEILRMRVDAQGQIFAAAAGGARLAPPPRSQEGRSGSGSQQEEEDVEDEDTVVLPAQQVQARVPHLARETSALYLINENGSVRNLWEGRQDKIYSLGLRDGSVLLGTGDQGRLYSVQPNGDYTLLLELDEMQITVIGTDAKGRIYLGTSNGGRVFRMMPYYRQSGEYLSEVIDAEVISQWGALNWSAEAEKNTNIVFFARAGNTEEPDKTWSQWSGPFTEASGQDMGLPRSRFLQFKAVLSTDDRRRTPRLKEVNVAYLQKNLAPHILEITVHKPGEYFPESEKAQTKRSSRETNSNASGNNNQQSQYIGQPTYKKGYRSVSWRTHDANNDYLSFDLYYRGEDEGSWKELAKDYNGFVYSWDTELVPDGRYRFKVVARDEASNPPAEAMKSEKVSQPLTVDNSGPEVSNIQVEKQGDRIVVSFQVEDRWTVVKSVEVAVNAEDLKLVYPVDGICDSRRERFRVELEAPATRSNTLVIKAKDLWENIGFGKRNFEL